MALVVDVTWMDGLKVLYDAVSFTSEECQWKITREKDIVILNRQSVREIVITKA